MLFIIKIVNMTLHTEKYKQAILYLCAKLAKKCEERKTAKCYFVDLIFEK